MLLLQPMVSTTRDLLYCCTQWLHLVPGSQMNQNQYVSLINTFRDKKNSTDVQLQFTIMDS